MWRRRRLVRQNDRTDCGAAALATLALHYGKTVGLEQMRDLTITDRGGTTLLDLLRAVEAIGFTAKAVKAPFEALAGLPLPAIGHLRDEERHGHFVVVYEVGPNHVVFGDPAGEIETWSRDKFVSKWTGYLLLAVPDPMADLPLGENVSARPWQRCLTFLRPHAALLVEIIFCALMMTMLAVATSYFIQHLVDSVLVRQERQLLNALGIGMALVAIFRSTFAALRQYLLAHIGRRLDLTLIGGYARHIMRLPIRFFETRRVGEILSRLIDAAKLREAISGTTTMIFVDGIVVLVLLGVLWAYDVQLALLVTMLMPLFIGAVSLNHAAARRCSREAMDNGAHLSSHMVENIAGIETIKVFGAERLRTDQAETRTVAFAESLFSLQKLELRLNAIALLFTTLTGLAVLWYGGQRVMDGALTIGQLLCFYSLLITMLEPLSRLANITLRIQDALVAGDRLFQILDLPTEARSANKIPFKKVARGIELRDVCFSYGNRQPVLSHINLSVPAGTTVAIVGESGSGKSTLLKLLLQYYQPTSGQVVIDGVDLRDFDIETLRSRIGVVTQDPYIFNGMIRENIALGQPLATLQEIIDAARAAGMDEFVTALPHRYDTSIGERGTTLSGGQRQRLAIARALVSRPEVLIFDEATSHLDTATERLIQENLRTWLEGRTAVIVAHRLSTIKDVDIIYVLHAGRIVEQGTHRQLLADEGRYADLWAAQSGAPESLVTLGGARLLETPRLPRFRTEI